MKNDQKKSVDTAELRRRAEEQLKTTKREIDPCSQLEMQKVVHELEVHQIELEMQNEELRGTQAELELSRDKYADLYDFAPVSYLTLGQNGCVSSANLTLTTLLDTERTSLIGKRFAQFIAEEARPTFNDFLKKTFTSLGKESCELVLINKGQRKFFVQIEAVADAPSGNCRAAIIDISTRKQLEKNLDILHADLEARAAELAVTNIELEAFNYTVSHDLRLPLTIISGYSQALQQACGEQLDEECNGFLQEINEATLRMSQIIKDLLRFSQVGRSPICRGPVDLSLMANAAAAELNLLSPGRQVSFRIANGILANGDAGLLRTVLANLIGNAWKYSAKQDVAVIDFGVKEIDGKQVFFTRDNGPGFNMDHAENLFIPFQRVTDTDIEGYGIGLATVERIIRCHGGQIWAESEPGKGATFLFTLD